MTHIGLEGLDPVFLVGRLKRSMGQARLKIRYRGKTYFFANQGNLELFELSPDRFLPQFDGFCAFQYALTGKRVAGDFKNSNVVGNKLYFYAKPYYASICRACPWILHWAALRYAKIHEEMEAA